MLEEVSMDDVRYSCVPEALRANLDGVAGKWQPKPKHARSFLQFDANASNSQSRLALSTHPHHIHHTHQPATPCSALLAAAALRRVNGDDDTTNT